MALTPSKDTNVSWNSIAHAKVAGNSVKKTLFPSSSSTGSSSWAATLNSVVASKGSPSLCYALDEAVLKVMSKKNSNADPVRSAAYTAPELKALEWIHEKVTVAESEDMTKENDDEKKKRVMPKSFPFSLLVAPDLQQQQPPSFSIEDAKYWSEKNIEELIATVSEAYHTFVELKDEIQQGRERTLLSEAADGGEAAHNKDVQKKKLLLDVMSVMADGMESIQEYETLVQSKLLPALRELKGDLEGLLLGPEGVEEGQNVKWSSAPKEYFSEMIQSSHAATTAITPPSPSSLAYSPVEAKTKIQSTLEAFQAKERRALVESLNSISSCGAAISARASQLAEAVGQHHRPDGSEQGDVVGNCFSLQQNMEQLLKELAALQSFASSANPREDPREELDSERKRCTTDDEDILKWWLSLASPRRQLLEAVKAHYLHLSNAIQCMERNAALASDFIRYANAPNTPSSPSSGAVQSQQQQFPIKMVCQWKTPEELVESCSRTLGLLIAAEVHRQQQIAVEDAFNEEDKTGPNSFWSQFTEILFDLLCSIEASFSLDYQQLVQQIRLSVTSHFAASQSPSSVAQSLLDSMAFLMEKTKPCAYLEEEARTQSTAIATAGVQSILEFELPSFKEDQQQPQQEEEAPTTTPPSSHMKMLHEACEMFAGGRNGPSSSSSASSSSSLRRYFEENVCATGDNTLHNCSASSTTTSSSNSNSFSLFGLDEIRVGVNGRVRMTFASSSSSGAKDATNTDRAKLVSLREAVLSNNNAPSPHSSSRLPSPAVIIERLLYAVAKVHKAGYGFLPVPEGVLVRRGSSSSSSTPSRETNEANEDTDGDEEDEQTSSRYSEFFLDHVFVEESSSGSTASKRLHFAFPPLHKLHPSSTSSSVGPTTTEVADVRAAVLAIHHLAVNSTPPLDKHAEVADALLECDETDGSASASSLPSLSKISTKSLYNYIQKMTATTPVSGSARGEDKEKAAMVPTSAAAAMMNISATAASSDIASETNNKNNSSSPAFVSPTATATAATAAPPTAVERASWNRRDALLSPPPAAVGFSTNATATLPLTSPPYHPQRQQETLLTPPSLKPLEHHHQHQQHHAAATPTGSGGALPYAPSGQSSSRQSSLTPPPSYSVDKKSFIQQFLDTEVVNRTAATTAPTQPSARPHTSPPPPPMSLQKRQQEHHKEAWMDMLDDDDDDHQAEKEKPQPEIERTETQESSCLGAQPANTAKSVLLSSLLSQALEPVDKVPAPASHEGSATAASAPSSSHHVSSLAEKLKMTQERYEQQVKRKVEGGQEVPPPPPPPVESDEDSSDGDEEDDEGLAVVDRPPTGSWIQLPSQPQENEAAPAPAAAHEGEAPRPLSKLEMLYMATEEQQEQQPSATTSTTTSTTTPSATATPQLTYSQRFFQLQQQQKKKLQLHVNEGHTSAAATPTPKKRGVGPRVGGTSPATPARRTPHIATATATPTTAHRNVNNNTLVAPAASPAAPWHTPKNGGGVAGDGQIPVPAAAPSSTPPSSVLKSKEKYLKEVELSQEELGSLTNILLRSDHCADLAKHNFRVTKVEEINNPLLWHMYTSKQKELELKYQDLYYRGLSPVPRLENAKKEAAAASNPVGESAVPVHCCPYKDSSATAGLLSSLLAEELPMLFPDVTQNHFNLNELYLLHGTNTSAAEQISAEGFDERRGSHANGALFGQGSYFTNSICKSHQYSTPELSTLPMSQRHSASAPKERCVLLSRVLLGLPYISEKKMPNLRRPPENPHDPDGLACDSVIGNGKDHKEFVVYENRSAVPYCLIRYQTTEVLK